MEKMLLMLAIGSGLLSLLFLFATFSAIRKKKIVGSLLRLLCVLLFLSLTALFATITIATQGYRALTHEAIVAVIRTEPLEDKRFMAHLEYPDGRNTSYEIAGDALYMDAHILKWKPLANLLGLHTAYELDRLGGRYSDIEDELQSPRTLYALAQDKPINLFALRKRFAFLSPLLDAEYGSAAFIRVEKAATFEIRVSTTGLLVREVQSD